jgi:predicted Rossmann fold nucleotide-binding protein DprA/Smf involved in DNA uptake
MASLTEIVALSLLWTETARVPADTLAAGDLDLALDLAGVGSPGAVRTRLLARAEEALSNATARGLEPVIRGGESYPASLAAIHGAPVLLWTRGTLLPTELGVAIVGSRTATPHAMDVGFQLGEGLARPGPCR